MDWSILGVGRREIYTSINEGIPCFLKSTTQIYPQFVTTGKKFSSQCNNWRDRVFPIIQTDCTSTAVADSDT